MTKKERKPSPNTPVNEVGKLVKVNGTSEEKKVPRWNVVDVEIHELDGGKMQMYLIADGEPLAFWTHTYQNLEIAKSHAGQLRGRLEKTNLLIKVSISELKEFYPRVHAACTENYISGYYYFIGREGYNRLIVEVNTAGMKNREVAERIEERKDKMVNIFTRYEKGEVLSIALDKENVEAPVISGKAAVIVSDCFDIAKAIHEHFGVDKTVASVHLLNGYKPEMIQAGHSGNIEPIIQLLPVPAYDTDEAYLTATAIGSIVGLSNRVINKLLKEWGYQIEKTRIGSDGRTKPDGWQPTDLGFPHGDWKINSDGHNGGKMYLGVQWRWKASILKVFEERMGLTLNSGQSKLSEGI